MGQIANQMALKLFFKIKERIKEKKKQKQDNKNNGSLKEIDDFQFYELTYIGASIFAVYYDPCQRCIQEQNRLSRNLPQL